MGLVVPGILAYANQFISRTISLNEYRDSLCAAVGIFVCSICAAECNVVRAITPLPTVACKVATPATSKSFGLQIEPTGTVDISRDFVALEASVNLRDVVG